MAMWYPAQNSTYFKGKVLSREETDYWTLILGQVPGWRIQVLLLIMACKVLLGLVLDNFSAHVPTSFTMLQLWWPSPYSRACQVLFCLRIFVLAVALSSNILHLLQKFPWLTPGHSSQFNPVSSERSSLVKLPIFHAQPLSTMFLFFFFLHVFHVFSS